MDSRLAQLRDMSRSGEFARTAPPRNVWILTTPSRAGLMRATALWNVLGATLLFADQLARGFRGSA